MVWPGKEKRQMEKNQDSVGRAQDLKKAPTPRKRMGQVSKTLHRVSFSAQQVDAMAKEKALDMLQTSGLRLDVMSFAQSALVTRRDDGGVDIEVIL